MSENALKKRLGTVANPFSIGCLWLLLSAGGQLFVAAKLWGALGWRWWIFAVLFGLIFIGFDILFALAVLVAVIAGFFTSAWPWSLATLSALIAGFTGNALVGAWGKRAESRPPPSTLDS